MAEAPVTHRYPQDYISFDFMPLYATMRPEGWRAADDFLDRWQVHENSWIPLPRIEPGRH